ncbi:fused MFS/spermidine synthase [Thermospira aquatica]|uniref:Fused MFS/spermidine synthase n=1 Tax=Thermospira aquatica TaxID=2828656 RepID=A0AAX3BF59_9SPIR|nr:fused MFS/spermidine synthase [Thermospira aquatica]URA10905.1 fused MFS/spermidine synthase [Thermospira aquatica]
MGKEKSRLYTAGLVLAIVMGGISLVLQALWQRQLALLTGNTLYGVSLVVGGWMAGYGVGSFLVMWFSQRLRRPLTFLVWVQIGVCALALLYLPWFDVMRGFPREIVWITAFITVFLPSIGWGMGLPLLGGALGEESLSLVYGWNTLASSIAVLVTDFLLLPVAGARFSLLIAVAIGVGVFGALVLFLPQREEKISLAPRAFRYKRGWWVLVLFGISGFTSLGYQLIYNRQLLYFTGNTIYCYGIITAVYIGGLALGSLLYHRWRGVLMSRLGLWIGIFQLGIALWHAGFPILSLGVNALLFPLKTGALGSLFVLRFFAPVLLIGFPVLLFGVLYPAFLDAFHRENREDVAGDTALAAGVNTLGSVLGILVVAFVWVDWLGVSGSLRLLAWISLGIGVVWLFLVSKRASVFVAGVAVLLLGFLPYQDRIGRMAAREFVSSELLYYREGAHGTVSVTRHAGGILHLKINGVGEVPTDYHSLRVFHFLGYMPFVFVPSATNILVIALGGGITFGSVMEVPGVQATNVEICPDVLEAGVFFTNYNHNVIEKHRDRIIIHDGYTYLLQSRGKYHLIIADATHPSSGDSWVLYTKEFYEMGRDRLSPGGIMAQWLPLHNLSSLDLKVILRTFSYVFPYVKLFFCNEYLVMMGGKEEFSPHMKGWERLWQSSRVSNDLVKVHLSFHHLADMLVWESTLPPLWEKHTPLSTRDFSPLQFSETRSYGRDTRIENIDLFLSQATLPEKTRYLLRVHRAFFAKDFIEALALSYEVPEKWRDEAWVFQEQRIESFLVASLRKDEGLQKVVQNTHPQKYTILRQIENYDRLFVGIAHALCLANEEKYDEALDLVQMLQKSFTNRWLSDIASQLSLHRKR